MSIYEERIARPNLHEARHLNYLVREQVLQPLPARFVNNKVVFVHPHLDVSSIKIQEGTATELAYQLMPQENGLSDTEVYGRIENYRVALNPHQISIPYFGNTLRYTDSKGIGNLDLNTDVLPNGETEPRLKVIPNCPEKSDQEKSWGAATDDRVIYDIVNTTYLESIGVTTTPTIAVAELHEVLDKYGNKISIAHAKEQGYLSAKINPVVAIRGWVTPYRLIEASRTFIDDMHPYVSFKNRKRAIILQSINDISSPELRPKHIEDNIKKLPEYLETLSATIATNLAKLHSKGKAHGILWGLHNITLDGRIIDVAALNHQATEEDIETDKAAFMDLTSPFNAQFLHEVSRLFRKDILVFPENYLDVVIDVYNQTFAALRQQ